MKRIEIIHGLRAGGVRRLAAIALLVGASFAGEHPGGWLGLAAGVAAAEDRVAGAASLGQIEQKAFRDAVDRVAPSVVQIEAIGGLDRVGQTLLGSGPTTGLVMTSDGWIVSSAFNFATRPASILVHLANGSRKPAQLVATDHSRRLVLLKIQPDKPLPTPEIAPEKETRVGQWAIAVGKTFDSKQPNMTVGVVSAIERIWRKAVQTDAAVSPNNYGGPLVDIQGRVLGVVVPLSPQQSSDLAGVEWYDSGIGFAIPAETIRALLPRLQSGKDLAQGLAGISMASNDPLTAEPVIEGSRPNSPARKAGLRRGDRILSIDGRPIDRLVQAKEEVYRRYAGDTLHMIVDRGGKKIESTLELVDRIPLSRMAFLGVRPLRSDAKSTKAEGVTLRYVYPASPAAKAGLQPGDVIRTFDGETIANAAALHAAMMQHVEGEKVSLAYDRAKERRTCDASLESMPETEMPDDMPPAPEAPAGASGERPAGGLVTLPVLGTKLTMTMYVPKGYHPKSPHGVVVWLQSQGEFGEKELLTHWLPACDRRQLIFIAVKPEAARWKSDELARLPIVVAQVAAGHTVDPARIVVAGQNRGGSLAFSAAFRYSSLFRGAAVIDAVPADRLPQRDPPQGLVFLLMRTSESNAPGPVDEAVKQLRALMYPVAIRQRTGNSPESRAGDIAAMARWIDALDRI
jgi:serine protease Do